MMQVMRRVVQTVVSCVGIVRVRRVVGRVRRVRRRSVALPRRARAVRRVVAAVHVALRQRLRRARTPSSHAPRPDHHH